MNLSELILEDILSINLKGFVISSIQNFEELESMKKGLLIREEELWEKQKRDEWEIISEKLDICDEIYDLDDLLNQNQTCIVFEAPYSDRDLDYKRWAFLIHSKSCLDKEPFRRKINNIPIDTLKCYYYYNMEDIAINIIFNKITNKFNIHGIPRSIRIYRLKE